MKTTHKTIDSRSLGLALRNERSRQGWTVTRCAQELGAGVGLVSRWERGERVPTFQYADRIARVFPALSLDRQAAFLFGPNL